MAREADMQVLGAQATELERDFPFGVAIQLFEPRWMAADHEERARLADGPAHRAAAELLSGAAPSGGADGGGDPGYAMMQGLFWLVRNLVAPSSDDPSGAPLLMLVDDVHCADGPSLRFLAYLAKRIAELPIGLVVAARPGETIADEQALAALRDTAADSLLRPGSLTDPGVSAIVQARFPEADEAFCRACARVTGGNAFLLTELLGQVEVEHQPPDADTAARLDELAPESVLNAVLVRLAALSDEARAVARAVAVLGDGAPVEQVARLSGLTMRQTFRGADALAGRQLFYPGAPLAFVHPLIVAAVKASMSPLDRAASHRRAAMILTAAGAPDEQVAAHLLAAPAESDPRAVESLRSAARNAVARGAAESAVRLLRRALAEQPQSDAYPYVLAELAEAESAAGLPGAVERLEDAMRVVDAAPRRAELALAQGLALHGQQRFADAAEVLAGALADMDPRDRDQAEELEAAYVAAALFVPERRDDARRRAEALERDITGEPTPARRRAVAHLALDSALRGAGRPEVLRLADLARPGAGLESDPVDLLTWPMLTGALLFVDELERDLELCDAWLEAARAQAIDAPSDAYLLASFCRAWPLHAAGRITEGATAAMAALDAEGPGSHGYVRTAYGMIACCHLETGQLEQAETALSIIDHLDARENPELGFLLDVRAQLRLAQLRPAEALEDAGAAGAELERRFGQISPGVVAWRSTAALAHLALGDPERASELAAAELEQARAAGVTRIIIRNLRVLGLAGRGDRGLELLEEAVRTGDQHSVRLEQIRALLDLGAARRRANQRAAAREPLRRALELSHRGGATALEERARTELAAAGARPRRAMLSGLESLTPSERRVADVAAKGLTTRQIAESLYVSPKTVEYHLRHIYQKLDIASRQELTRLIADGED
jgi:DNA-binding NarL/FixJ family response regulator